MRLIIGSAIVLLSMAILALFANNNLAADKGSWMSVIPPFVAVLLAFVTRRLLSSLLVAVLCGGVLVGIEQGEGVLSGATTALTYGFDALTDPWSLKILGFVFFILAMISVIIVAGGLKGLVHHLERFTGDGRRSQLVTAVLGLLVFIDDYANTMIVGSSMRSVTDSHRISRQKLAFIIDATSAPVAGLAIISTWIGYETGLFSKVSETLEIGLDGYAMFFDALAFRFYCILMLLFVFMNILMQREYGPMLTACRNARLGRSITAHNEVSHAGFSMVQVDGQARVSVLTGLIPLALMFLVLLSGLWIDGGGLEKLQSSLFSVFNPMAWLVVISSAKNSSTVLLLAASTGLITACAAALTVAKIEINVVGKAIVSGIKSSLLPVAILVLAWALKSSCDDLHTGEYLAQTISQVLEPQWFPILLFLAAALTSFGTGTSWGTMAILIPTAIPVAYALDGWQYGLITMMSLGAVLDGAIFGDHCSPISDTTIMSSIASGCDHLEHVKTQIPYSLTVAVVAGLLGYAAVASGLSVIVAYLIGFFVLMGILYFSPKLDYKTTLIPCSD